MQPAKKAQQTTPVHKVHHDHEFADINEVLKGLGETVPPKEAEQNAIKLEKTPHKSTIQKIRKWATLPVRLPLDIASWTAAAGAVVIIGVPVGLGALVGRGIGMLAGNREKGTVAGAITAAVLFSPAVLGACLILALAFSMSNLSVAIKGGSPGKFDLETLRNEYAAKR